MNMRKYIIPTTNFCMVTARMSMMQAISSNTGLEGFFEDPLNDFDKIK